jgi:hypothetical protein
MESALNQRVRAIEVEFGSLYAGDLRSADGIDLTSALVHDAAMEDLRVRGVVKPSEALYAAAVAAWHEAAAPGPTYEGAAVAARAESLLRAAGRATWTEQEYLEALKAVGAES